MSTRKQKSEKISAKEFDKRFDRGEDISDYLDLDEAVVVKRINVDFPMWMVKLLDREAVRLNVSRQAVIKMWINDRLKTLKEAS